MKIKNMDRFSGFYLGGIGVLTLALAAGAYWVTGQEMSVLWMRLILSGIIMCMGLAVLGSFLWFRSVHTSLTKDICDTLDDMISGKRIQKNMDMETLSSKVYAKVKKLGDITRLSEACSLEQKEEIKQIVSDISHQLKTPIANIIMYSDTIEASGSLGEEEQRFLRIMRGQIDKLEFLIQALVKMSRLESNMLEMKKEKSNIFAAISKAISAVLPAAAEKKIEVQVHCPPELKLFYDPKWTEEAIFNVLENAVKYTPEGGNITLLVEPWQLYTRIQIHDTGIGVDPGHQNDIFKRFYREDKVHKQAGAGIGLYLAREILTKQGGYITVSSLPEKGSCFSLFLPNRDE